MAGKLVLPRVHVMALCDEIELCPGEDETFNLRAVRARLRVATFPFTYPQLCVYLQLTGHTRTVRCYVEIIRTDTEGIVFRIAPTSRRAAWASRCAAPRLLASQL
jgi:hypothetical protein